jgi:hypothetical protein
VPTKRGVVKRVLESLGWEPPRVHDAIERTEDITITEGQADVLEAILRREILPEETTSISPISRLAAWLGDVNAVLSGTATLAYQTEGVRCRIVPTKLFEHEGVLWVLGYDPSNRETKAKPLAVCSVWTIEQTEPSPPRKSPGPPTRLAIRRCECCGQTRFRYRKLAIEYVCLSCWHTIAGTRPPEVPKPEAEPVPEPNARPENGGGRSPNHVRDTSGMLYDSRWGERVGDLETRNFARWFNLGPEPTPEGWDKTNEWEHEAAINYLARKTP